MPPVSLLIAIASGRDPKWPFVTSFARSFAWCARELPNGSRVDFKLLGFFDTAQARRKLVWFARERGDTHIAFADDDMLFPYDAFTRLLAHDKDIIGANYTSRFENPCPLALKNGKHVPSRGRTGIEGGFDHIPTGLMMIKTSVFDTLEKPYFLSPATEDGEEGISDDVYFCRKARAAGFDIWVDHDLSVQTFHTGQWLFGHNQTPAPPPGDILDMCREVLGEAHN